MFCAAVSRVLSVCIADADVTSLQVGDDGFSHLAANGDADSFFLCSGTPHSQVSVVYKPTDEARCDAVVLHIVNA